MGDFHRERCKTGSPVTCTKKYFCPGSISLGIHVNVLFALETPVIFSYESEIKVPRY